MAFLRLVILGPPGSGKGTIGKLIASTYQLQHISSGDALRDHVNRGTDIGQKVKEYIDKGVLVSDDLITKLMISEIECNKNNRWILDGYPRTLNQGETLYNRKCLEAVLYLNVPFDTIIDRIKDRWVHAPSGRVYNLLYNPPKTHGKDDLTGEPLTQRSDDLPETVRERLMQYQKLTSPLLGFYQKKNLLVTFTGTKSDEIFPEVKEYINFKLAN